MHHIYSKNNFLNLPDQNHDDVVDNLDPILTFMHIHRQKQTLYKHTPSLCNVVSLALFLDYCW